MNEFFWSAGHLGWGIFTLAAFTGLWWLLSDLVWRLRRGRTGRLVVGMVTGWLIGIGLILLMFCLGNR